MLLLFKTDILFCTSTLFIITLFDCPILLLNVNSWYVKLGYSVFNCSYSDDITLFVILISLFIPSPINNNDVG